MLDKAKIMDTPNNYFVSHPLLSMILSILSLITAEVTGHSGMEIPIIAMQLLQILFWVLGGIAACLSIYGSYRKLKDD